MSAGGGAFGRPPPSHHPPIRDASTLKYVLYGPGHEKFPSWPMAAAAEVPVAIRAPPTGGSQRSKSWTDHTNYPKEQVVAYTRPYMKRSNSTYPQQLKTVLERCEKKNFESIQYLHTMDRRKSTNSNDYNSPSPPERDVQKRDHSKMTYKSYSKESITPLTQADLEEYTKKFDETTHIQHQKQSSYAQSEGYHSYVSSSDSSSTPFIDSLRRDIDVSMTPMSRVSSWDGESIVTTRSGSVSSSETLKWHGSLSDMSDVSNSSATSPRQLIVHSARVQTPQKQNSESVLYMPRASIPDRLIPQRQNLAHTLPLRFIQQKSNTIYPSPLPPRKTVAECINIYEGKNIKAIQKKALMSFYERHQDQMKKDAKAPEQPSPYQPSLMRQSSADYPVLKRLNPQLDNNNPKPQMASCDSPNSIFQGPVIMGPSISLDEWVPERPPKNRQLMMSVSSDMIPKPRRIPSPDLPLPAPPPAIDDDAVYKYDDPLPPPPEKTKDVYPIRTSVEGYVHPCDTQKSMSYNNSYERSPNPPVPKLRDLSIQPYSKQISGAPRKFINPYIKSSNMKYDVQHKIDKVPSKLSSNHAMLQIECETTQTVQYRKDNFNNKLPALNKSIVDKKTRSDPMNSCKMDYCERENLSISYGIVNNSDSKSFMHTDHSNRSLENVNMPFEVVGRFRAEPVNLETASPFGQSETNDKPTQDANANVQPMVPPKIHRSMSETNQVSYSRDMPVCNNNFSKTSPQNQSMRKMCNSEILDTSNQHQYGRQESIHKDQVPFNANHNFQRISRPIEKDIKDEKPPLPEKKRSLPNLKSIDVDKSARPTVSPQRKVSVPSLIPAECEKPVAEPQKEIVEVLPTPEQVAVIEDVKPESPIPTDVADVVSEEVIDDIPVKIVTVIENLVPRKHLPEENQWDEHIRPMFSQLISTNQHMKSLLSEFNGYDNTAQHIVDAFAPDVISLLCDETAAEEDKENISISTSQTAEPQSLPISRVKNSEDDEKSNVETNFTNDANEMENHLKALVTALEKQSIEFDEKMKTNDELGSSIAVALEKPHSTRFSRFMTDIGLITSLISSLLSRYNRITSTLNELSQDHQNRIFLESEKSRLTEKLEDARALKKNIDNNRSKLFGAVKNDLNPELMDNYKNFVCTKIKLVIYARDIKDRIDIVKRILSALSQDQHGSY